MRTGWIPEAGTGTPGVIVDVAPFTTIAGAPPEGPGVGMLYVVPATVTTLPGVRVLSPTRTAVEPPTIVGAIVWPPTVRMAGGGVAMGALPTYCVTPLTSAMLPLGPRLMVFPFNVTTGPPGFSVSDPTMNWPCVFAVTVLEPTVMIGAPVGCGLTTTVEPPTTTREPPPSDGTTTATPLIEVDCPTVRVWEPMTTPAGAWLC